MAQFPVREADIIMLAANLMQGLQVNDTVYPTPPHLDALTDAMSAFGPAQQAAVAAQAAAESATVAKAQALETLTDAMKANLRWAELTVNYDDAKLQLLGWGGRAAKTATTAPGQCRLLEAPKQGEGWLFLDWKEPVDGGKTAAYRVERRERPAGTWETVASAIASEAMLLDQPRSKEWEYRVLAINKAGEGEPSNTVLAVL